MPRSLTSKVTLAACFNVLLLVLTSVLATATIRRTHEAVVQLSEGPLQQAQLVADFSTALSLSITEALMFIQTRDSDHRDEMLAVREEAGLRLAALQRWHSQPKQRAAVSAADHTQLQARRRALMTEVEQQTDAMIQAIEADQPPQIADVVDRLSVLQHEVAALHEQSDDVLQRDITLANDVANQSMRVTWWSIALAVLIFGLPIWFGRRMLQQRVVQPINALADAARAVGNGNLDYTLIVTSNDEIGAVQRTFNQMIYNLKDQSARLIQQAFYDSLTHLPNRRLFINRLDHALGRAARYNTAVGLLLLDLDNFKVINDSLGHDAGDRLLTGFAAALQSCVRPGDTVARLGGDEFTILLEDIVDIHDAVRIALRIFEHLQSPLSLDGQQIFTMVSIGITLGVPGDSQPEQLLREADMAMYRAKTSGKSRYAVFDPHMTTQARDRLELEQDLRRAIENDELQVYYQPIVCLTTERIVAMEALVRWEHPHRGFVSPAIFTALAEETGLIVALGRSVLTIACRQMAEWHQQYGPIRLCVNLSPRQFRHPALLSDIRRTLQETGLQASSLELEITESVLMDQVEYTLEMLHTLKELGIHLAIDDFGTGYSSLAYLQRFPIDTLKIDRSFMQGIDHDPKSLALIRTVIMVAKALNLQVIAEGIETPAQLGCLQQLSCELGQGYHFARPLPPVAATAFISSAT